MPEIQEEPIQRESETKATPPPPPPTTDPSTPKSDTVASPAEAEKEAKAEAEDQSEAKTQTKPKPKTRPKPKPKPESKQTDLPPRPKRKRDPTKPRAKKAAKQPASEPRVALEATEEEEPKPAAAPTPPSPASLPPPPEKAITFFPVLPAESNPIDEVILQRLAECWDEESPRWDLSMREDFIANIPRARVTRTTVQFTNHNLVKHVRASAVQPSWGQWMVLRVMFGPGICSRQKWFKGFAEAFPLAKEPAYDGVVPVNAVDVLDGKAMMPLQRKRKAAVWQLQRQRTRITKPKEAASASAPAAAVKKEAGDEEGDGASSSGVQVKEEQDEDEDVPDAGEKRWKRARVAVKGASKMTPGMAIRQLEQRYKEQDAQIRVLRESNGKIRRAVDGYLEMLRLLDSETIKFEVADEPVSGDELA